MRIALLVRWLAKSLLPRAERGGRQYRLTAAEVCGKSRAPSIVKACGWMFYVAVRKLGQRTSEIAELLHVTPAGVSTAARRGAKVNDQTLVEQLLGG